jgi:hypothetical protein
LLVERAGDYSPPQRIEVIFTGFWQADNVLDAVVL